METFPKVRPTCGKVHQGRERLFLISSRFHPRRSAISLCSIYTCFPFPLPPFPLLLRPAEVCCLQCSKTAKMGRNGGGTPEVGRVAVPSGGAGEGTFSWALFPHILLSEYSERSLFKIHAFISFLSPPPDFLLRKDPLLAFLFPTKGWWDLLQFPICVCEREGRRRRRHFDGIFFLGMGEMARGSFHGSLFFPLFQMSRRGSWGKTPFRLRPLFLLVGKKGRVRSLPSSSFSPPSFFFSSFFSFFLSGFC